VNTEYFVFVLLCLFNLVVFRFYRRGSCWLDVEKFRYLKIVYVMFLGEIDGYPSCLVLLVLLEAVLEGGA